MAVSKQVSEVRVQLMKKLWNLPKDKVTQFAKYFLIKI